MTQSRQLAKKRLVAQAMVIAKVYVKTADDIEATVREMLDKGMDERDMVEQVTTLALTVLHEAPIAEMWHKLTDFEVNDR